MSRVLVTGMSGTGKSSVIDALAARGYTAIDADTDAWSHWVPYTATPGEAGTPVEPDRDWVWREDRMHRLLAREESGTLFVSGCAINMRQFLPRFDHIILLSAPAPVLVARLATRTNNPYGKHPAEVARVLELRQTVEPRLRSIAHAEIDTSIPLDQVVETILRLAQAKRRSCRP